MTVLKEKLPDKKILIIPENGQICLGRKYAGKTFQMEFLPTGEVLLKPGTFIPDSQQTFYTSEAKDQLAEFDKWQKENPVPQEDDSRTILKDLIKNKE